MITLLEEYTGRISVYMSLSGFYLKRHRGTAGQERHRGILSGLGEDLEYTAGEA